MYKRILVPIDLADPDLAKPAVATALMMAAPSDGTIRFINVLPLTPVMLAEYVPPDFEVQQRKAAEDALAIVVKETGLPASRVSSTVRQGGIYQEILEEASNMEPDLIVMSSHRPHRHAVRTYFQGSNAGHVVRQVLGAGGAKLTTGQARTSAADPPQSASARSALAVTRTRGVARARCEPPAPGRIGAARDIQ